MTAATTSRLAGVVTPGMSARQAWEALGAAGLLDDVYQQREVAAGVDPGRLAALLAELDATIGLAATLPICIQLATALPLLAAGSGPAREVLADALRGTASVALAATDEAAGSDLAALTTEVRIGERELVVTGAKRWIANAARSEYLLVLCRHRPGRHFTNFTWVLVPVITAGVLVRAADTELFEGSHTGHIDLRGVRLPRRYLLGSPGRGMASFASHIATERLAGALWGVALCKRVLADTRQRLTAPRAGGTPLWQIDTVRQRFATCLVQARQLQALTAGLAERVARQRDTTAAAILKAAVATTTETVLSECAHLQGAEGFGTNGIQRLRAQAALFGIGGGTTEVMLSMVADAAPEILLELTP